MRRLALLSLLAYLSIVFSPFAMAIEGGTSEPLADGIKVCPTYFENLPGFEDATATETTEFKNNVTGATATCGEENPISKFLEKGDCTEEGKVITEISEVFAGDTSTGEGDTENKIVTVYKGSCCFVTDYNSEDQTTSCKEVVEVYKKEYTACTTVATGCQKRQWVIGTSGAGIIKVYVKQIYRWAAITVGSIAVVTMVISGIRISMSGVSGDISAAKTKIMSALAGLVLLFLSGLILYTINPTFFS